MNGESPNVVVAVAPVHDCRDPIRIDPSRGRIDPGSFRWIVNPADAIALEQALRIRDASPGVRIRVVSVAPPDAEDALRECLAAGADEAVRVWGEGDDEADSHGTAAILAAAIRSRPFRLVLAGWRRADVENAQAGPMVAELLGLPQVTCARRVELDRDRTSVRAEKRVPGSVLTLSCALPALVTVEKGPPLRYPRYPDRRRSRAIPIERVDPASIGVPSIPPPRVLLERVTPPKPGRRSSLGAADGLPVAARLQRILSGGAPSKREGNVRVCPDRESVEKAVRHLIEEKLVTLP